MNTNQKLKEYLKENGITQAFICEKTGLTSVQVSKIVNGTRKITADELVLISKALRVSPEIFF